MKQCLTYSMANMDHVLITWTFRNTWNNFDCFQTTEISVFIKIKYQPVLLTNLVLSENKLTDYMPCGIVLQIKWYLPFFIVPVVSYCSHARSLACTGCKMGKGRQAKRNTYLWC